MLTKDFWIFVAILSGTTDFNNLTDDHINILCGPHGKNNEEVGNLIDLCYIQLDRSGLRANDRNISSSLKCWNKYVRGIIGDEPDCGVEEVVEATCDVEEVVEADEKDKIIEEKDAKIAELVAKIAELELDKEKLKAAISVLSN